MSTLRRNDVVKLNVNGKPRDIDVAEDTPLLWTLRDVLNMTGTKFGCGAALCGACTIHIDGQPVRSCVTPVSAAHGKSTTTIEGIAATPAGRKVQAAWLELDVVQCGTPVGPDHVGNRAPRLQPQAGRCRHRQRHDGQHLPLRHLSAYPRRNQEGRRRQRQGGVR
jgi:hypothetical protein